MIKVSIRHTPCVSCLVPPKSYLGLAPYEVWCKNSCDYSAAHPPKRVSLLALANDNITDLLLITHNPSLKGLCDELAKQ